MGFALTAVTIVLRRTNLVIFDDEYPPGGMNRLRRGFGLVVHMAWGGLTGALTVGLFGDQTLVYLRFW